MWTFRRLCASLLLCCLLLVSFAARGHCYEITTAQLQTLEANLTALQANNQRLSELLSASDSELTTARSDLDALLKELAATSSELWRLKGELQTASTEAASARQSLRTANAELRSACQSVKKLEATSRRRKWQRALWQAVAAIAAGAAITR